MFVHRPQSHRIPFLAPVGEDGTADFNEVVFADVAQGQLNRPSSLRLDSGRWRVVTGVPINVYAGSVLNVSGFERKRDDGFVRFVAYLDG
jgi:hypothetical protein